ncbi:MAG: phospholipase D-like domain-containing protein [Bacteriovoracaceae bacterium]
MVSRQPFSLKNKVRLVRNGQEFIETHIQAIKEAKEKILFLTYIFEEDEVSEPVVAELIKKAEEGVKVFFIVDAFGSPDLSPELRERFRSANVQWAYFAPLFGKQLEHMGRRLHQKLLLIDNHKAIAGGINLAKKFIHPQTQTPWLDYSVMIEGEEVYRLEKKIIKLYTKHFPEEREFLRQSMRKPSFQFEQRAQVRSVANDFMRFKTEIYQSYIHAIKNSQKSIRLTAAYFLPGKRLLKELRKASKRGVEIELIFGVFSDHQLERWSSKHLYSWYLSNNVKIYEWGNSILHAKAALIDDEWASIGSYNHNYLSRYACLELNIEVKDKDFGEVLRAEFDYIKENSIQINREKWSNDARWYHSLFYFLTYTFSSLITFISLFFIIRKKEKAD